MQPSDCQMTLVTKMRHAPFPYDGPIGDTDQPFFDRTDPLTGKRWHGVSEQLYYPEQPHYSDNRVLLHAPPGFDPSQPMELVIFFHGHGTELEQTLIKDFRLPEQINRSGRNVVLIAPQLVREGRDSSPGKLSQRHGMRRLLEECVHRLANHFGKQYEANFHKAPVILVAYSGGYRTLAYSLDRGGIASRIRGVILLDALYSDLDKYMAWLTAKHRHSYFVNLHTISSQPLTMELRDQLRQHGIQVKDTLPVHLRAGGVYMVEVDTPHEQVPLLGPPAMPVAELLQRAGGRR